MTGYVSKRAAVNGVNLHYIVAGEGPVVLAMHGWPQNHREFLPLVDNLAGRYRFIAPDLREETRMPDRSARHEGCQTGG
jgi:pimeloyl-ACP methyl ester carboxylesterase